MKKKDLLETVLEMGSFISFSALIIVVLTQVITRFLIPSLSFVWTEEASRFLFVYSVAFGAPLAMKKKEYVNVDILFNILPKKVRKILEFVIYLVIIALFTVVFIYGIQFAQLGITQNSPTMGIPMVVAYSSISISCFFIIIYGVVNLIVHAGLMRNRGDI